MRTFECETCRDTGYYGDNCAGVRGNNEYQECDICNFWGKKPLKTVVYPDYTDSGDSVLYYAEFFGTQDRVICKVYKRQWLSYASLPKDDYVKKLFSEVHPFVLFEFVTNENTEPRRETVKFMVDGLNEKYNREKL